MAGSRSGQEVYEMILEHPVPADSEESTKMPGVMSKGLMSQLEEAPPATEGTSEPL